MVGVTEAEILCGDWADPQWCRLPVLLGQGNERRDHFLFLLPLQSPIQLLMAKAVQGETLHNNAFWESVV